MQRYRAAKWFRYAGHFILVADMASAVWAQGPSTLPTAPSPQDPAPSASQSSDTKKYTLKAPFPNLFAPYTAREIAPAKLANTPRIDQLLHEGKLYLSMNDAVALALENNLDLAIARYNLNIADTDLWRARAGQAISGVNAGVVQNTPGGGAGSLGAQVGTGQGGTSTGAGGAGAGAGGIVGSTLGSGPPVTSFDPLLTSTVHVEHLTSSCNTPFCATNQNTTSADFTYNQSFHWGTDMTVGFNNSRVASNSVYNFLSPSLTSNFQFQLTQHLLQGFGLAVNTRYIEIAKNNREISDVAFRLQVTTTVDQIENLYWNLAYAYEDVQVQKQQLVYARQTLANNKRQVEIGSLAPIEVVRAQSLIASDEQTLTVSLTNLDLQQLLMKNAISRTLEDPVLADAEVIPTSTIELPPTEPVVPTQDLVNEAFAHRADLAEARINLINTDISKKAIRSALLPTLDVSAFYGGAGLGGSQNPNYVCFATPPICGLKNPPPSRPTITYGSTLQQLVNSTSPDKGVQFSLNIPLRNRAAQATQVRSEFEYRQAQLHMQQLENQVRIEVRNAQFGVQQNRAAIASAQAAVDLARQAFESEQKKFDIRASTLVLVLQTEAALAQAEATFISAKISYAKAEVDLDRATGLMLEHAGILIADAQQGQVTHSPRIPNVVPSSLDRPSAPPSTPQN